MRHGFSRENSVIEILKISIDLEKIFFFYLPLLNFTFFNAVNDKEHRCWWLNTGKGN